VDIVAVATHGRSGISRTIFGSVADQLIRESGKPVLVIKAK
jgi:nucleotide-binding universal stress UspA family protein